jgi:hypothetical protein
MCNAIEWLNRLLVVYLKMKTKPKKAATLGSNNHNNNEMGSAIILFSEVERPSSLPFATIPPVKQF